jgi:ribosomal protein S24E
MSRQESTRLVPLEGNMTLEIINELYNPLIDRREIQGRLHHQGMGTPKIPDLRVAIAKALGVDFKLLFIRKLVTETGLNTSKILIHIYKTVSDANEYEPKHVKEKNKTLAEEIEEAEKEEKKKKKGEKK